MFLKGHYTSAAPGQSNPGRRRAVQHNVGWENPAGFSLPTLWPAQPAGKREVNGRVAFASRLPTEPPTAYRGCFGCKPKKNAGKALKNLFHFNVWLALYIEHFIIGGIAQLIVKAPGHQLGCKHNLLCP